MLCIEPFNLKPNRLYICDDKNPYTKGEYIFKVLPDTNRDCSHSIIPTHSKIVRCKDCVYFVRERNLGEVKTAIGKFETCTKSKCEKHGYSMKDPNGYCSLGIIKGE